jgi:acetyl esterase
MNGLDPQLANLLELTRKAGKPPFQDLTPHEARAAYAASWVILQPPKQEVASVQDVSITTPDGPLALRIYRGIDTKKDDVLPALMYLHGGGWVIGNLESHDRLCRSFANLSNSCVVAVDYRLAPEHRYPAAVNDFAQAFLWVHTQAKYLMIDDQRIGVGGDSAGGYLAAVLALMSRDGQLPSICMQVLLYPVTDLTASCQSYQRVTSGVPLTADTMYYFIDHYAPKISDRKDWRASPLLATSLKGTAPAFVMTVGHDPLCDEGRAYAQRLEDEGVRVTAMHLADHMHGMLMHGRLIRASLLMTDVVGSWIKEAFVNVQ